ncbi:MAG: HyaD/HybD family hydrogenase maturation endopeptidase [Anaerolineales bacterium]
MTVQSKRTIVLGLGNTLNKDEGLGVHALKTLEVEIGQAGSPLEFVDGGVLGLNLLPWVEESSHLLILDAINARKEPGTVIEMTGDEIPMYTGIKMSDHQITFQEVLGLARFRQKLPQNLHLIGAQPLDLSIGVDLSPEISAVVPEIIRRAKERLSAWGLIN